MLITNQIEAEKICEGNTGPDPLPTGSPWKRLIYKAFRIVLGISLVLIGVVGLIMPIMPGWVFIIPGLVILGDHFPPVRRLLAWARRKLEENDPGWFKKDPPPVNADQAPPGDPGLRK